jgi:hypothetical protein
MLPDPLILPLSLDVGQSVGFGLAPQILRYNFYT